MNGAVASGVAAWVLTYAVHSTLLLGVTWLVLRLAPRASWRLRERLWKLALFGGLATAGLQAAFGLEPLGGRFALAAPPPVHAPDADPAGPDVEHPERAEPAGAPRLAPSPRRAFPRHLVRAVRADGASEPSEDEELAAVASSGNDPVVLAWLALGVGPAALALGLALARLRAGLRRRRRVLTGPALDALDELRRRAGMRRRVRLSASDSLAVPVSFGIARPEICVPERALADLGPAEQEAMIAHELGHLARRDPLWRLASRLVVWLFPFQLLNRVALRELSDAAEYLCDDWAVAHTGRELSLARCLTEVASWVAGAGRTRATPALAAGMAEPRGRLGGRVRRLLAARPGHAAAARDRASGGPVLVASAAALTGVALVAPGIAAEAPDEPAEEVAAPDAHAAHAAPDLPDLHALHALHGRPAPTAPDAAAPTELDPMLAALDGLVAELEDEVAELRTAVLGLEDPEPFLAGVAQIEQRIARLRERREELLTTELLSALSRPATTADRSAPTTSPVGARERARSHAADRPAAQRRVSR